MRNIHILLLSILFSFSVDAFSQIKLIDPTKEAPSQKIERISPDFRYYYQIKNESDTSISDLRINISPFISKKTGAKAPLAIKIDGKERQGQKGKEGLEYGPFPIAAKGNLGLELTANLMAPGEHYGKITFYSRGKTTEENILVDVKTDSSLSFSIANIANSRNTVNPFNAQAEFWVSLVNESSFPQSLRFPRIKEIVKVIAEEDDVDPKFNSLVFYDESGNILNEKQPIKLGAGEAKRLKMLIKGLADPGKYKGKLRLSSSLGGASEEASFTLLIRHAWLMAAIMILLGVVASTYIKTYLSDIRPQLEINREIGQVIDEVKKLEEQYAHSDPRLDKILHSFSTSLELDKDLGERGQTAELKVNLGILRRKIALFPEWKEAWDRAEDPHLKPRVPIESRNKLLAIEKLILKEKPSKLEFETAEGDLDQLEKILNNILNQLPYLDRLEKMEKALEVALGIENLDKTKVEVLKMEKLVQAQNSIKAMDFQKAEKELNAIERELQIIYMEPSLAEVGVELEEKMAIFADKTKHKSYREESISALKVQKKKLSLAKDRLRAGAFEEVHKLMGEISASIKEIKPSTKADKKTNSRSLDINPSQDTFSLKDFKVTEAVELGLKEIILKPGDYDPDSIDRKIRLHDWIVSGVISVIALIFGLSLLWSNNQTWGSSMDYLSALLWGLGLHQVGSGGMFAGLGSIQNTILGQGKGGQTPPPPETPAQ
ncbi:MAG: hypothetical protein AAF696_09690 [Bacteroidota bacterium]